MSTINYKGVFIHQFFLTGECTFLDLFENKKRKCVSLKSAKNQITRMLREK